MPKAVINGWELPWAKSPPPVERMFKLVASPESSGYEKATVLLVTIPPGGTTNLHTHPDSDEIIYVMGRAEGTVAGEKNRLETDSVIVAPKGIEHECRNTSETDMLKLFCVFLPPIKLNPIQAELAQRTKEYLKKKG